MNPKIVFSICHVFMTYFAVFEQVCHFHIDFSFVLSQQLLPQTKRFYETALVSHLSDNDVNENPTTISRNLNVDLDPNNQIPSLTSWDGDSASASFTYVFVCAWKDEFLLLK